MGICNSTSADSSTEPAEDSAVHPVVLQNRTMHPAWSSEKGADKITRQMMKKTKGEQLFTSLQDYESARDVILTREAKVAFDWDVHYYASDVEKDVARIVKNIKADDVNTCYKVETDTAGNHRLPAGHFLGNVEIINKSELIKVARAFPKGAHLHCHYNSCLPPKFLIEHARGVKSMWIKSSCSLATPELRQQAEIQFQVQKEPHLQDPPQAIGNLMDPNYAQWAWMRYSEFRDAFGGDQAAEEWLCSKMLLNEKEVYGVLQTVVDIWLRFDICTRMMKGLFGYESAFRAYTKACIKDFIKDKISYAEIRPNFPSNVLRCDNGIDTIDNRGMMRIIVEEMKNYTGKSPYFAGLKVIYCCPRSFSNERVKESLVECIALKKEFPNLICGYDLVGSEDRGKPLKEFIPEFLWFQEECKRQNLIIPFLFHAGETLDTGSSTDLNLLDAVLLNSKRIGHGFALTKHPEILQMVKDKDICLEICPISNEILHLTATVKGHALPDLLARGVHCTVNSDNGTFYSSTLSHDFYQIMIGSESMDVLGWKQLALWSLEHSEMTMSEKAEAIREWKLQWKDFCDWIKETYGERYPQKLEVA